ncbi:hypothetical protein [Rhizobacter sp. Root16D2]|jgi:hypothetical protein|uniref:hypothetical protein n=1 Tax=Rhizobacter sp. Root16D2 TaxID=1736479 RepID=UPI0012F89E4C|nr:hypothetical protein [Rhizobacter sp. Root16D2]
MIGSRRLARRVDRANDCDISMKRTPDLLMSTGCVHHVNDHVLTYRFDSDDFTRLPRELPPGRVEADAKLGELQQDVEGGE